MAGTPAGEPGQDSAAGQRADEDALGWGRPVPQRWAPPPNPAVSQPAPPALQPYVSPVPLTPEPGAAVIAPAPGERQN